MTSNNTGAAIVGGDWPHALPVTTYAEPRPKPKGLDWATLCPPADEVAQVAPIAPRKRRCMTCGAALTNNVCGRCVELEEARRDATFIHPKPDPEPTPVVVEAAVGIVTPEALEPSPGAMWNLPEPSLQFEWAQLLHDTADSTDRTIVSARFLALAALEHLRLTASERATSKPVRLRPAPVRHVAAVSTDDVADIVRRYKAGDSIKKISGDVHRRKDRVTQILKDAGVTVRGRGGGNAIDLDDPESAATARRLYVDEHMTIEQASDQMGMSPPTFSKLMKLHGIRVINKGSSADRLVGYRQRLADLGVTSKEVSAWWNASRGNPRLVTGPIPSWALDAYEDAHR